MESDNVSTDDDGQRYPGARSRYHPTELKKPGSKQWKVHERFNSDVLLLSLGTARNSIRLRFILIQDWFYRLHLPGRFQAKRIVSGLIRQILVLENAEIRKDASGHVLREVK